MKIFMITLLLAASAAGASVRINFDTQSCLAHGYTINFTTVTVSGAKCYPPDMVFADGFEP